MKAPGSFVCPECGAVFTGGESCQDRFNLSQLKEIEQPPYYAVHHLSVPCYMLQHQVYTREGWIATRQLLDQFVNAGWTPEMARREIRQGGGSRERSWSFTRGPKLQTAPELDWSFTMADIRLESAASYCSDVRRWARRVLEDSEELVRRLS